MIIIKPGMMYLDIINEVSKNTNIPILSYQVSGEYSMLKLYSDSCNIPIEKCMYEALISFKRAGANAILCYDAINMAQV